jgi:hypothetical protein
MNEDTDGRQPPGRPQQPGGRQRAGRLAAALVPAALAGTILLAACGGGSPEATPAASHGLPTVQMLDSFATCMRSHGVPNFYFSRSSTSAANTPDNVLKLGPWIAPANPSSPQFQAAMQACRHVLPLRHPSAAQTQAMLRRLVKEAACLRSHGYPDYPDPSAQGQGIVQPPLPADIDISSPQFLSAQQACSKG